MACQHPQFYLPRRITHRNPQQEPVQLAFGQRVRSLELDRVLRGDHHERTGQRIRLPVDRHLPLAHRFQKRALRARGGPVDLVGQHQVGEDRARVKRELPRTLFQDRHTDDVGRQEIARELDAVERPADRRGQRPRQRGLSDARHVFNQQVTARQERDDRVPNRKRFPANDARHVGLQGRDELRERCPALPG